MSRIGQKPIDIPSGITPSVSGSSVSVKGPKGELALELPEGIALEVSDNQVSVSRKDDTRESKSLHGLIRSLVANMVVGVNEGFKKELEVQGVGFKAEAQGQKLTLTVGLSSPVVYMVPDGVSVSSEGGIRILVSGTDKQKVGNVAARIRSFRPAEPYKGKGIRYVGEQVRRKVGKTVA
jgi:large subunit ribosomal protein L6